MKYKNIPHYKNPIKYNFSRIDTKDDENWDILCSEYHEEIGEIVSSYIIELNKWKDVKTLEALGLKNLDKLNKLVGEAINNLENKNE